jgi:hypothetical protein
MLSYKGHADVHSVKQQTVLPVHVSNGKRDKSVCVSNQRSLEYSYQIDYRTVLNSEYGLRPRGNSKFGDRLQPTVPSLYILLAPPIRDVYVVLSVRDIAGAHYLKSSIPQYRRICSKVRTLDIAFVNKSVILLDVAIQ